MGASELIGSRAEPSLCGGSGQEEGCLACEVRPISVCGALQPAELLELQTMAERRTFAARESVAVQGERSEFIYNVTSGMFRVYSLLPDGRRQIVGFLLPGDFFGLALGERFTFCADAVVPSTACCFRRAAFSTFLDRTPHLMRRLHEAAAHEMTVAHQHLVLLGRERAERRILHFLVTLRQRWARVCGKASVTIPLPMSRADIGDYLGLTIETVSRTLNQLARDRLILIVPNGIRLLDIAAIERLAGEG